MTAVTSTNGLRLGDAADPGSRARLPDEVGVESGMPAAIVKELEVRGHKIVPRFPGTSANSILVTRRGWIGAADTRTRGALAAGY